MKGLEALDKKVLQELKSLVNPPSLVQIVLECTMHVLGERTEWAVVRGVVSDGRFTERLKEVQMCRIAPFFPLSHGIPRVDDRRVISGIFAEPREGLSRQIAQNFVHGIGQEVGLGA